MTEVLSQNTLTVARAAVTVYRAITADSAQYIVRYFFNANFSFLRAALALPPRCTLALFLLFAISNNVDQLAVKALFSLLFLKITVNFQ